MSPLTDDDYDALYVLVRAEMPRVIREIFPKILAQPKSQGVITITVTASEITVTISGVPVTHEYRVGRKRKLH